MTLGLDLEVQIVTELTQRSTLPSCVKYSLGIIVFSLNIFSYENDPKAANPVIVAGKAKKSFWTNSLSFTEINYSNPVDCNRKKSGSLPEICKYILLLEQYDDYDPLNDPFTVIIIGNDNALLDWS